ncbi:MAG: GatB/YqeY domain-containing protein [Patescibacteria group bacterium]
MLKEKLNEDMKAAMKSGDSGALSVLRMLLASLHNKEIDLHAKKPDFAMTDEIAMEVLRSEAKKRKDSILAFEQGGRNDLSEKEKKELAVIERYLPKQLGKEELEPLVEAIIKRVSAKDFGSVMKEVMKELKGKGDAGIISGIIKEKIK